MTILKRALLGSLRIAFLGSLKVALSVYALFLSDTSYAGALTEGNGRVGDTGRTARPKEVAMALPTSGKRDPMPRAAHASGRLEFGLLGRPNT